MRLPFLSFFLFSVLSFFILPSSVLAADPLLTLEKNGEVIGMFSPEIPSVGSVALGDLGSNGISEMIVATGYGTPTKVYALRQDGSILGSFSPYHEQFMGGASVAVCDLDNDGEREIVTGAGFSGGPHVRIFESDGTFSGKHFFAYETTFTGGVNILCRDITGDGTADIITSPGPTGGPHVKVFSSSGELMNELSVPDFPQNAGLSLYMLPGNNASLFVVPTASSGSLIATISFRDGVLVVNDIETQGSSFTAPLSLSSTDGTSVSPISSLVSATESSDAFYRLSATPTTALTKDTSPKYIHVDISTQTLTAYEYGIPAFSFLVSTGVVNHPTPLGKTEVMAKLPVHDYVWYYAPGNPNNYNLPGVRWNLRFRQHYYIHSAYWHNNFGNRMSHGCVNVSMENAEKIFNWADVGTPVEIVE